MHNITKRKKPTTIYTPDTLAQFIYDLVCSQIEVPRPVFDPCTGQGALLKPFRNAGFRTIAMDIEEQGFPDTEIRDFLLVGKGEVEQPSLVIMNPPFNTNPAIAASLRRIYQDNRRRMMPEVFFTKVIELFDFSTPVVMISSMDFRLGTSMHSSRAKRFVEGLYPEITSIISLPQNVFEGAFVHAEVLIFNVPGLKPHYFYSTPKSSIRAGGML